MTAVRCMLMRGGTSKGAYFLADDLPSDAAGRDELLLRLMGSPDPRQIDGIGGGHPLTSKVAVISASSRPDADVDYLFLQVKVDGTEVSSSQNCGNILAGVGPYAVERGLIAPGTNTTCVRIYMINSGSVATARFASPGGAVSYDGDTEIAGVPGRGGAIDLAFADIAGSTCGALFPTGNLIDHVDGTPVTCVDNGMPVVVVAATDLEISGTESPHELETNPQLTERISELRSRAGALMGFDDVAGLTVPKVTVVSPPTGGGTINTRTFIPVRCHTSIGVLGALTVAAATRIPGTIAHAVSTPDAHQEHVRIEHPTGYFDCDIDVDTSVTVAHITRSAVIRTARKLFDGYAFPGPPRVNRTFPETRQSERGVRP